MRFNDCLLNDVKWVNHLVILKNEVDILKRISTVTVGIIAKLCRENYGYILLRIDTY